MSSLISLPEEDCRHHTSKRTREAVILKEDRKTSTKRSRLQNNTEHERTCRRHCESSSNNAHSKFLMVHLQILKLLYQEEDGKHKTEDQAEENFWQNIERFLKERRVIKTATRQAQSIGAIYDEAVEFEKSVANLSYRSSALMLITQPSPLHRYQTHNGNHPSHYTGCLLNGTTNPDIRADIMSTSRNVDRIRSDNNLGSFGDYNLEEETRGNAFGIVSGLLKHKYQLSSKGLGAIPIALVTESKKRIENLDSQLNCNKKRFENNNENDEDFEPEMEW